LPKIYIEPPEIKSDQQSEKRIETLRAPAEWRKRNYSEVEVTLSPDEATRESLRCLRCDLEFTKHLSHQILTSEGNINIVEELEEIVNG